MAQLAPTQVWDKRGFFTTRNKRIDGPSAVNQARLNSIKADKTTLPIKIDEYPINRKLYDSDNLRVVVRHHPTTENESGFEYEVSVINDEETYISDFFPTIEEAEADRDEKIGRIIADVDIPDFSPEFTESLHKEMIAELKNGDFGLKTHELRHLAESTTDYLKMHAHNGYSEYEARTALHHYLGGVSITGGFLGGKVSGDRIPEVSGTIADIFCNRVYRYE